jgi:transposase-like protein
LDLDWCGYDALVDVRSARHLMVNQGEKEFALNQRQAGVIESFWSFANRRLRKFNGVLPRTFYLHLKECEYRFNNREGDLVRLLLNLLERSPL